VTTETDTGAGGFSEQEVLELAQQAYEGDACFPLACERTGLLVIDMQDEFVRPLDALLGTRYDSAGAEAPTADRDLPPARGPGHLYRLRRDAPPRRPSAKRASMPNRYVEIPANPAWFRDGIIWHELAPAENEIVIHKPSSGAFYDTPLQTILTNLGRDTIIICGTLTNFCCGTTARQGYERGFNVVVGDLPATDDRELQESERSK
jgi:nicotinamidase-related amidase